MNIVQFFIPELILVATIVIATLIDAAKIFRARRITLLAVLFSIFALYLYQSNFAGIDESILSNYSYFNLLFNKKIHDAKLIILLFSAIMFMTIYGYHYINSQKLQFEYILVVLISVLASLIAVMVKDLLTLVITMEIQMLGSYILTSMQHKNIEARAAAIKYFILGTVVTCFMLFGMSLIYGFAGSIEYEKIKLAAVNHKSAGLALGIILVIMGLMFKLGAAPLHFWIADVYQGTNILTITFFTLLSKISTFVVLWNLLEFCMPLDQKLITGIIMFFAVASIIIGAIGGLGQFYLKRLLAYSSIFNIGFAMLPLIVFNENSWEISIKYLVIYALTSTAFLLLMLSMDRKNVELMSLQSISGLGFKYKYSSIALTITLISLIGIPPIAGFFVKYDVISHILEYDYYNLTIFAIMATVVASAYYLQIIKALYFSNEFNKNAKYYMAPIHGVLIVSIVVFISFYTLSSSYFINSL
ncbi:MAG: NADH-quinone oxidoreductase subunit N [Rickettsiaceae bacterium]|nr:NADH-quinone oxidoreductase subunit N [Rickettsiaceae bacterium]